MMRHMALDVGDERIGVAVSDPSAYLARPLDVIARRSGPSSFQRIAEIVRESEIGVVVVGLPLLPDGTRGKQVRSVEAYVAGLVQYVDVPIVYWDERYSSRYATEMMLQSQVRRSRRRSTHDAVAAAVILQEYMDDKRGGART